MKCKVFQEGNQLVCEITPILTKKPTKYKINHKGKPSLWNTATSNMTDSIGNILSIDKNKCSVRGVFFGQMRNLKNVRIADSAIKSVGERVMVTEHVDITGKFELIATKRRILYGDLNYVNVGYPSSHYVVIDVYTGEYKIIDTYKVNGGK